jgi:hypothetical protein
MLRRFAAPVIRVPLRRAYFYAGAGEEGIAASTMKTSCRWIYYALFLSAVFIYKVIFGYYSPKNQWIFETTDLFDDDGTVMEGPEAVANLRIARERYMPRFDQMQENIDASQ